MKVFLRVSIEVSSIEKGKQQDVEAVKESVQEAVFQALEARSGYIGTMGFDHKLEDEIRLSVDYAEVIDTDLVMEF